MPMPQNQTGKQNSDQPQPRTKATDLIKDGKGQKIESTLSTDVKAQDRHQD
jgi:hypothetical protein